MVKRCMWYVLWSMLLTLSLSLIACPTCIGSLNAENKHPFFSDECYQWPLPEPKKLVFNPTDNTVKQADHQAETKSTNNHAPDKRKGS